MRMDPARVLITGGAGFIGTNLADRLARDGHSVTIYDNMSRTGVEGNVDWLRSVHGSTIKVEQADVCDAANLRTAVSRADHIFHLAAQVAVTSSVSNPRHDFEVNLGGTINLLEAIRSRSNPPSLVFTSTNKVYGGLNDIQLERNCTRYLALCNLGQKGVDEQRSLDFHSPYGCSKGAADQYILDYARTFGIPAVVFRMSCIYGPHQMGNEDQGWIAHFILKALRREAITICGDGFQVRDALFVADLVDALVLAQTNIQRLSGQAFNIGGGPSNTVSLLELIEMINALPVSKVKLRMEDWRVGDQRFYVSNTQKFRTATGWSAQIGVNEGVTRLFEWLIDSRHPLTEPVTRRDHALLNSLILPGSFEDSIYFGCREPHLPLEFGYSKSLLERSGHEAQIIDAQLEPMDMAEVVRRVENFNTDFSVVTTAPSYLFWRCAPPELRVPMQMMDALRGTSTLVAVGPHGSTTPRATLSKLRADMVVMGECEEILPLLSGDLANVPSLCRQTVSGAQIQGGNTFLQHGVSASVELGSRADRAT